MTEIKMPEKDISERLRSLAWRWNNPDAVFLDVVEGGALLGEAADEIDSLRFELQCARDERDAIGKLHNLLAGHLEKTIDERDAARAEVQCLNDRLKEAT